MYFVTEVMLISAPSSLSWRRIADVVGLYLHPPTNAVALSVNEKTQIQALNRTQPLLPMRPAWPRTHDYRRNGSTSLYAALNVGAGQVVGPCRDRHTAVGFSSL